MDKVKNVIKQIPFTKSVWKLVRKSRCLFANTNSEDVFTKIYRKNKWNGINTASGSGSDVDQTAEIIKVLPSFFDDWGIRSILDIPCGDFHWMKNLELSNIEYIGGDIVEEIIVKNRQTFRYKNTQFQKLNIMNDCLPKVDLVFCRDCLVHFSYNDIFKSLANICSSHSSYLMTTFFSDRRSNNDILTGEWRPLNLTIAPFGLPKPLLCINEKCTEINGNYDDKSLGLWKISDIQKYIEKMN